MLVYVDEQHVLDELSIDQIKKELVRRRVVAVDEGEIKELVTQIYTEARGAASVPESVRKLVWEVLGKVL